MREVAWLNGRCMPLDEAKVSVNDRGFVFGDGVYEALIGYGGRLWAAGRHWRRLERSLRELSLEGADVTDIARAAEVALTAAGRPERPLVYLQVTRGTAPRLHAWEPGTLLPTIVLTVRDGSYVGRRADQPGVACLTTADQRWGRCDIKSLNLLPNCLAKQQAHQAGCAEAILLAPDGTVTEGTSSSLCIVRGGTVSAHPNGPAILPGITRAIVFGLAADLGIPTRDERFDREALLAADEVFLCGTGAEVSAVATIDGETIADGAPGPVTQRLLAAYHNAIDAGTEP